MAEEIIINDVDVTECKYYNKCSRDCEDNNVYDCVLCANIPNCHYKQLKRAEQKLEKIKEYCNSCNLKADSTACDILQIIEGNENE